MDHINKLPVEVLCMIFDRLSDVKNVSLVCRRWNDILFHTPYVNRFRMILDTESMVSATKDQLHPRSVQRQRTLLAEATKSNRSYRHVLWIDNKRTLADHHWILNRILPQPAHLVQLELIYDTAMRNDLMPALADALPNMHQLRVLILQKNGWYPDQPGPQITTLSNASVQRLELSQYRSYRMRVKMPNLRRFRGQFSCDTNGQPNDELFPFFDECHPKVSAMHLEHYCLLEPNASVSTWDQLAFFPHTEDLTLSHVVMCEEELERLLAVSLPKLRTIGFYGCYLAGNDIARIHECLPSTVRKVIVQTPTPNPRARPGSPFRD